MTTTEYRHNLLERLDVLREALVPLAYLSTIFDEEWYAEVRSEILGADLTDGFRSDSVPFFMLFGEDHRSPLFQNSRAFLPALEVRLAAVAAIPGGEASVAAKLREVRSCRSMAKQLDFLFELSALGVLAARGHLIQIEPAVGNGTVDGLACLDGREVLVEATHVTQKVLPEGPGAFSVSVAALENQIRHKLQKKVASGRQLALADKRPTVLAIALGFLGASQLEAEWALQECFGQSNVSALSAVIVSDSWKLISSTLHVNPNAKNPLTTTELQALAKCLGEPRP